MMLSLMIASMFIRRMNIYSLDGIKFCDGIKLVKLLKCDPHLYIYLRSDILIHTYAYRDINAKAIMFRSTHKTINEKYLFSLLLIVITCVTVSHFEHRKGILKPTYCKETFAGNPIEM